MIDNNKELAILINFYNDKFDENILEYNHIQILSNQLINFLHHNVSYYCFNQNQINLANYNKWDIFLSFIGNDLYNLKSDMIYNELFWFPTNENIESNEQEILKITQFLNEKNQPICIAYNEHIQKDVTPEKFRLFLIKINQHFKNPLFEKELELVENEKHSDSNHLFILKDNEFNKSNAILGLYGDLKIDSEFNSTNIKTILKNTECKLCEYNNLCIDRGLGYIMNKMNYKGCIGIKLFNQ